MKARTSVVLALVGAFALGGATTLGADEMTLTGTVGDARCGLQHRMDDARACTLGCVARGSDYALIVEDKAYTLKTSSDETLAALEELAGMMAVITGDVTEDTIAVASVEAVE